MKISDTYDISSPINVILVESMNLLRDGLYSLISGLNHIHVAAQAASSDECISLSTQINPDVVLCIDRSHDLDGIELGKKLQRLPTQPRLIIVTTNKSREWISSAIQSGVCGIIFFQDGSGELILAIMAAHMHHPYLSPCASTALIGTESAITNPPLTPRQTEILRLYAQGNSTKQIAFNLKLSIKTVSCHREQILQRLELRTTSDLIIYAIRNGIVAI